MKKLRFYALVLHLATALFSCSPPGDGGSPSLPSVEPPGELPDVPAIEDCVPGSWNDDDLATDPPALNVVTPQSPIRVNELPLLSSMPALQGLRDDFISNTVTRANRITEAYGHCNPQHRLAVGGVLFYAHENNIRGFSKEALVRYVDYLHEAGVGLVGIHMGPYPWLDPAQGDAQVVATIAKYDAIMERIRALGMKPRFMLPITNSSMLSMSSWEDYRTYMLQLAQLLIKRYNLGQGVPEKVPFVQVGMHEPSSICHNLGPSACDEAAHPEQWRAFVNEMCDTIKGLDPAIQCTATLIAGYELDYEVPALRSKADFLGVNNIDYYSIRSGKLALSDEMIGHFRKGMTDPADGQWVPGKGDKVFLNAMWRPTHGQTVGKLLESNAAGIGCSEYDPVDSAYLDAIFTYARAHGMRSVTAYYTDAFIFKKSCPSDTRLHSSVLNASGTFAIPNFQEGNSITDALYRSSVATVLGSADPVSLTDTGSKFRSLAQSFGHGN